MPGYVIHFAIGKKYIENNNIRDKEKFLKGCIALDLLDKKTSRYGNYNDNPDSQRFLSANPLSSEYKIEK